MMRPVPPPDPEANVIVYEHPDPDVGDLPAEVVAEYADGLDDPSLVLPTRLDVVTHWQPDAGERKALANGAPVILRVEGPPLDPTIPAREQMPKQPPVALAVGDVPDGATAMLDTGHVTRALGVLYGVLAEKLPDPIRPGEESQGPGFVLQHRTLEDEPTTTMLEPDKFLALWERIVEATREMRGPGDGASVEDIALPGDVRSDL